MADSTAQGKAVGYDATVSTADLRDPVDYLAARVDEIEYGIKSAEAVAVGARQTAATLRGELKDAKAALQAARAGAGD